MNNKLQNLKRKAKTHAPAIVTGITIGVAATAFVAHRMYHPKDKIAIQFPNGVLEKMREMDQGVAIKYDAGWLTIKHYNDRP